MEMQDVLSHKWKNIMVEIKTKADIIIYTAGD